MSSEQLFLGASGALGGSDVLAAGGSERLVRSAPPPPAVVCRGEGPGWSGFTIAPPSAPGPRSLPAVLEAVPPAGPAVLPPAALAGAPAPAAPPARRGSARRVSPPVRRSGPVRRRRGS